jgi:predicted dehydrogenase
MLKGAIVGLGNIALSGHWPGWQKDPGFKIVAGVDVSPERQKAFLSLNPGARVFSSLKEALSLPLDFVDIAVPPHLHFSLAQQALNSGLHVLCEKPLVLSEAEFKDLKALAICQSKVLFTVHNWKFAPILKKMSELSESGSLGPLQKLDWYVLRNGPSVTTEKNNWRLDPKASGGGIWVDHGWHACYLILNWFKKRPVRVEARFENRLPDPLPVEDTANVKIYFEGDGKNPQPCAEIFFTWVSRLRKNAGRMEGSNLIVNMEDSCLEIAPASMRSLEKQVINFPEKLSAGSHHADWFGEVIREFALEVQNPDLRGNNLAVAEECLRILLAAQKAHASNCGVAL